MLILGETRRARLLTPAKRQPADARQRESTAAGLHVMRTSGAVNPEAYVLFAPHALSADVRLGVSLRPGDGFDPGDLGQDVGVIPQCLAGGLDLVA